MAYTGKKPIDHTDVTQSQSMTVTDDLTVEGGAVDINGNELILDADGDTSITADTDDQIDFKTGGTDRMQIDSSGNIVYPFTNGTLYVRNGNTSGGSKITTKNAAGDANGYLAIEGHDKEYMRVDSSGNVGIGTSNPTTYKLFLQQSSSGSVAAFRSTYSDYANMCQFLTAGGSTKGTISATPTSVSYNTSSDYRLKENAVDISDGITRVKQLQPKRFNFIADDSTTVDGFMAHEAQAVVPEAVTGTQDAVDDDGNPDYQGIDQSKLVPLLTAALKEAITKIEALETKNADFETRIAALEAAD